MRGYEDLSGRKFGELTVIKFLRSGSQGPIFLCKCSCGNLCEARATKLRNGQTVICGKNHKVQQICKYCGRLTTRTSGICQGCRLEFGKLRRMVENNED